MLLFPVGPLGLVFDLVVFVRLIIIKALLLLVHIHRSGTGTQTGAEAKYHYPNEAIAKWLFKQIFLLHGHLHL